ncbi:hypothetical protein BT69DRAFT_1350782, partial [Atractiella rhizophila]
MSLLHSACLSLILLQMSLSPHEPPTATVDSSPPITFSPAASKEHDDWFSARQQRILSGERERLGRALSAVVQSNLDERYNLSSIRFLGLEKTRASFLQKALEDALRKHREIGDQGRLRDVLRTVKDVTSKLEGFGIFEQIAPSVEHAEAGLGGARDLDVVFHVKEAARKYLKTSTDVGDGEGSVQALGRVRNVFGGAETVEGAMTFGSRTRSAFQLRFDSPVFADPDKRIDTTLYASDTDLSHFASCTERLHGFQGRFRTVSPLGYHELSYDAVLRRICDLGARASMSMRESAGTTTKSAVSHTVTSDTREDVFEPSKGGMYYKLTQELAGLGGDAKHIKGTVDVQKSLPLSSAATLSLGFRSGLLYTLSPSPSLFSDRFHLGGPSSVRMFKLNTLGPKDYEDWVGGDAFWAAGASLYAPIPKRTHWPLLLHGFVNAGRLVAVDRS